MVAYEEDRERLMRACSERWAKLTFRQRLTSRLRTAWALAGLREWKIAWLALFSSDGGGWP